MSFTYTGTPAKTVTCTYDATGTKLKMVTYDGTTTTTTDYVGGFVYVNTALSFFGSPEGRVVKNGSNMEYQYAISDHQGNTRVLFTSATQTPQTVTATFETAAQASEAASFQNYPSGSGINLVSTNNHTPGGSKSQYLNGGYIGQIGVAKSYKVFPGDQVKIEAWGRYNAPSGTSANIAGLATALLSAFGLPAPAGGEVGTPSAGVNSWGNIMATGFGDGSTNGSAPKAFINIIIFDKNYNFLDFAWTQVTSSGAPGYIVATYTAKEVGYAYLYVSNEHPTLTDIYFDDVAMTYTPSNVIQGSEYYPFGLQSDRSWTRDNVTKNDFLYDAGNEKNSLTGLYDLFFRNYDPALGRMHQVDPLADSYSSHNPYHYGYSNPIYWSDPSGAKSEFDAAREGQRKEEFNRLFEFGRKWGTLGDDDANGSMFGKLGTLGAEYDYGGFWMDTETDTTIDLGMNTKGDQLLETKTTKSRVWIPNPTLGTQPADPFFDTLPGGMYFWNTRMGQDIQTIDFMKMKKVLDYGGSYGSGGLALGQIGMLRYRTMRPPDLKVGTFQAFSLRYSQLGMGAKILGRFGTVTAFASMPIDYKLAESGQISYTRAYFRIGGTFATIIVGAKLGSVLGPWGTVGGSLLGLAVPAMEQAYDGFVWFADQLSKGLVDTERSLNSGWYPGK